MPQPPRTGVTTTYTYDANGNRVKKTNGSSGTLYWYSAIGIVAESDLSGNLQHEYVFFAGRRVARKDLPSKAVSYYFADHLQRASVITDSAGNIKAESDYYPFGGELQIINNDSNDYKFTGKKRDLETGLDYFGARYYSSAFARFLSADWFAGPATVPYAHQDNPQTLNLYGYVDNNPINQIDADGHAREYMVAPVGSWGPNMLINGPVIEVDTSGTITVSIDTETNIATILSVQVNSVTEGLADSLSGTTGQSQSPGNNAGIASGDAVGVGERPLLSDKPFADRWSHTYLLVAHFENGTFTIHSFGLLGEIKNGKGTSDNQQVTVDDRLGRNGDKAGSNRNHLYVVPVTAAQREALYKGAMYWTSHECPSCGSHYVRGGPGSGPAYNSNTWVYNMLIHNPAGRIEPPAAINPHDAPGWAVNDVGANYYPQ